MSEHAIVALDVGGTTVDVACVSGTGELIGGLAEVRSPQGGTKNEIVAELAQAIVTAHARARADGFRVAACGIAMPAPFDYAAGVSRMEHKFRAILGLNLGALLRAKTGLATYFINDADAFGLGVSWRQLPDAKRFAAITIGTGLGGSFVEDGRNLETDPRVPPGGEVWDLPFGAGILEDYVSARGVVTMYGTLRPGGRVSAKDVSDLARRGNPAAIDAYRMMGTALGRGLAPVLRRFEPEQVVIGGHVAQSLDLFGPATGRALTEAGVPEVPILPPVPGNLAIWGAARYAMHRAG
jgi:glucokinase